MAKPRTKKILKIVLVVLAVVIVVVLLGGYIFYRDLTRGPLPQHDGELYAAGLNDKVEILRDKWGIPHIYASNMHDLFFAQGYTQAQDRWWQMELWRHIGSGRLEELTGKNDNAIKADLLIRTMGWRQLAELESELLDPETKSYLLNFADGVNAYISSRNSGDLALEYGVLRLVGKRIKIEPWTPADTLVWAKVMAWDLGPSTNSEETRAKLYELLGPEMTNEWMTPPWPYGEKPTILQSGDMQSTDSTAIAQTGSETGLTEGLIPLDSDILPNINFVFGKEVGIGSNNWVVSGNLTESGMPLLANDPHLSIQMPSIWYEIGLHCQSAEGQKLLDVTGFTFAPMPGVVIGHNSSIAWGVTNNGPDVADLYKIRVNPNNPFQYEWNGAWRDMTVREETIHFAGSDETTTIQVRETHLGPIINDNKWNNETKEITGLNNEDPMALRWTALDPSTLAGSVMLIDKAQNWEEFRSALQYWDVPSQNFVYADINGNIGYQMPGRIPIRAGNDTGLIPAPGWTSEFEWQGFIPFEDLPSILNPERGYIVTANQAVVTPDYYDKLAQKLGEGRNYVFSREWDYGYRAQRITEMINATQKHTIASFQNIQGDTKSLSAEELIPYLANLHFDDAGLADARDWLLQWGCRFDMESPQAVLYSNFWARLLDNLFNDQLHNVKVDGEAIHAYGTDADMRAVYLLMQYPDNAWWDDISTPNIVETRDDILLRSFREGYADSVAKFGKDRNKWKWGQVHTATFVSLPLGESGIGLIEHMVNRGPFAVAGTMATVNNTAWVIEKYGEKEDFSVDYLPSMRMIVDLSDLTQSVSINTTGQSGHPFSANYADMIDLYRNIEYHSMMWSIGQVEASAVERLILNPSQ
jgi:penicillin amidase